MGVVFRQSVKTTIITFTGALLGGIVTLYSSNVMPKQELGFVRILPVQAVIASFLLGFGMNNALFFYLHRFEKEEDAGKRPVLLSLSFLLPLAIYIVATLAYFLFFDHWVALNQEQDRPLIRQYFWCLPLFTLLNLLLTLIEAFLHAHIKAAQASFVREVFIKGGNLVLFLLFGLGLITFSVFVPAFVSVNLLAVIVLWKMAGRNIDFRFSFRWKLIPRSEFKGILTFALFHAFMGISGTLFGFLDTQLLTNLSPDGLASIPVYTNAVFIATLISIPFRALSLAASGDISKAYAQGDHERVADSYNRAGLNIFIASMFMVVLVACNLHNAVAVLKNGYEAVFGVTLILILGRLVDSATGLNDLALNMSPYFRVNFYFSGTIVLLMIAGFYLAIPAYGVYGAAWVFSGALILFNLAKTWFVWYKMRLHPFSIGTLKTLFIAGASTLIVYFIPASVNPYWDVVWRSSLIVLCFAILVLLLKPGKDVTHFLAEVRKKKRLF
jgi:O-antigen/teichoic acid export membrane protein